MQDEADFERLRLAMVQDQIASRNVKDPRVLAAMRITPRHCFVLPDYRPYAYNDCPLPIGFNQTISQPYIVAFMTEQLELRGGEKVLEVGTGSGYQAAILSHLAREVITIERLPELADHASRVLMQLGYDNVTLQVGDGSLGFLEQAPYDAIIVTAAAPRLPQALLDQLGDGGRLIIPVGSRGGQYLEKWKRKGQDLDHETILPVAFVPLLGQYGWQGE